MKVAELLDKRRRNWKELERLCEQLAGTGMRSMPPITRVRFAALHRAACADLALADAYQLPPNTVHYLHNLVGRAHNQLYRSRRFDFATWSRILMEDVPQRVFRDGCVQLSFVLFWGAFLLSAFLAYSKAIWPEYAEAFVGRATIETMETMYENSVRDRSAEDNMLMAAFYIQHNTSIGLKSFAGGLLVIPGLYTNLFNASYLGAVFGYMARPDVSQGDNFFEFVTAHGPFELTAIALAAGAGLRLGMSLFETRGFTRADSLRSTAKQAMPVMASAMVMFFAAALIEGFISPSGLPYWMKATVAILSSGALTFYFVVLGMSQGSSRATG